MRREEQQKDWREELLKRLNPTVRPRVEGNAEYEDIVALLAAWLQATDEHLSDTEEKVVNRLSTELAPGGDWKFPMQTLAIPKEMKFRDVEEQSQFDGTGGKDDQWRPCGAGWTRPTALADWRIEEGNRRKQEIALVCDIRTDKPDSRLLLSKSEAEPSDGQQLAFICGDDALVNALAGASWGVQHRGESGWQAVTATRYQDYQRFERGIGGARARQRQLAAWLPPFYPYSRKFLRFALTEPVAPSETEWGFLSPGAGMIRLAARIDRATADKLEALRRDPIEAARVPMILNAVPVAQMQMQAEELLGSPFRTNEGYARTITSAWGVFAAAIQETYTTETERLTTYPGASLSLEPAGFNALRPDEQLAVIRCDPPSATSIGYQARLYSGCRGEEVPSPRMLSWGGDFTTPFPALGGKNAPVAGYGDAGARHAWYHSYLRSPQPTVADIIEILTQIPSCREYLVLGDRAANRQVSDAMIQLDIENRPRMERSPWENYLWPTLVTEETLLEMRASFLSESQVAIMPRMRLRFNKRRQELPGFLWRELERYAASVLSQYFMIGWYRLEGVVREE